DAGGVCAARIGAAVPHPAGRTGRARRRAARGIRRHHGGCGVPGRRRTHGTGTQCAAHRGANPGGDGARLPEPARRDRAAAAVERSLTIPGVIASEGGRSSIRWTAYGALLGGGREFTDDWMPAFAGMTALPRVDRG